MIKTAIFCVGWNEKFPSGEIILVDRITNERMSVVLRRCRYSSHIHTCIEPSFIGLKLTKPVGWTEIQPPPTPTINLFARYPSLVAHFGKIKTF